MAVHDNFLINLSVLYRNTQKYFDRVLAKYDIGSGQLLFLLMIYENDGITMQEITRRSEVDKGTTTKSISRLIEQGYVEARVDEKDRRVRHLHTAGPASRIMADIYDYRARCRGILGDGCDFAAFEAMLAQVTDNSRKGLSERSPLEEVRIGAFTKLTMRDVPGKTACRIDLAGCCFRCPWCNKKDLVFLPEKKEYISPETVMEFLKKRIGILDAVVVSGGEPLVQEGLLPLLEMIKEMGYPVYLETCGYEPQRLKEAIDRGLVDHVAMDVKNSRELYARTVGVNESSLDHSRIEEAVNILLAGNIPYEFRTTLIHEFHDEDSLMALAQSLHGAKKWVLRNYMETDGVIQPGFTPFETDEAENLCRKLQKTVPNCILQKE